MPAKEWKSDSNKIPEHNFGLKHVFFVSVFDHPLVVKNDVTPSNVNVAGLNAILLRRF